MTFVCSDVDPPDRLAFVEGLPGQPDDPLRPLARVSFTEVNGQTNVMFQATVDEADVAEVARGERPAARGPAGHRGIRGRRVG